MTWVRWLIRLEPLPKAQLKREQESFYATVDDAMRMFEGNKQADAVRRNAASRRMKLHR